MKIKLEVGEYYRTCSGEVRKIVNVDRERKFPYQDDKGVFHPKDGAGYFIAQVTYREWRIQQIYFEITQLRKELKRVIAGDKYE